MNSELTVFFLFFIGVGSVTGNVESGVQITNENNVKKLEQVVCESTNPRTSFFLAGIMVVACFLIVEVTSKVNFHKEEVNSKQEELRKVEVQKGSVVNLNPVEVQKSSVVKQISEFSIQPIPVKKLDVDESELPQGNTSEGKCDETTISAIGESLQPEIILEDFVEESEIGEQMKINERKPCVFVGGISASTTPIELVSEFRKQGFNVTVLPRIRYGVSFGFCPDLVLSSIEEVEELLACERVWVKDRWVDIRPYIPKDCPAAAVAKEENVQKEHVEYINVEDLHSIHPSTCTPPLYMPAYPPVYPLSPIYAMQTYSPELPFLNSHAMQTYSPSI